jgi:hypothetical protein
VHDDAPYIIGEVDGIVKGKIFRLSMLRARLASLSQLSWRKNYVVLLEYQKPENNKSVTGRRSESEKAGGERRSTQSKQREAKQRSIQTREQVQYSGKEKRRIRTRFSEGNSEALKCVNRLRIQGGEPAAQNKLSVQWDFC